MYCTCCGNKINKGNNFCKKCGAALKVSYQDSSKQLSNTETASAKESKSPSCFYLHRDNKNYGPYSLDNLILYSRQGKILPSDMIYSQSEGEWNRADKIAPIASAFSEGHAGENATEKSPKQNKGKETALIAGLAGTAVVVFGLIVFLAFRLLGNLGLTGSEDHTVLDQKTTIEKPITMQAGEDDITMGDFSKHGLLVQIPQASFDEQTEVTLSNPDQIVYFDSNGLSPLGAPLKIEINGQQKRLSQPATIIIGFDSTGIKEQGEVFAAYYHDLYGWELFRPEAVDLERGIMGFSTYHFSEFCAVQADEERRIKEYVKKKSIDEFANTTWGEQSKQEVERMVKQLLKESLNVPPENKIAQIITRAVIEEIPGGKYGLAIYDGKPEDFTNEVLSKTFEHITYNGDSLKELGVEDGPIAAMSRAAASFSEGEYEDALKHLSEGIADSVPAIKKFKKVGETTIKVTKHIRDDLYLETEMMKAFDVYKNGSDAGRYGYNVSAGDWTSVVAQGHGFFSKFSYEELAVLKQNFDKRIERWEEIDRIEAANTAFIELMQKKGYLNYGGNPMISEKGNEDLEMLLNRLFRMSERIRRESDRYEIVIRPDDFERAEWAGEDDNLILAEHIAILVDTWYTEGQEAYIDKMIELGLIEKLQEQLANQEDVQEEPIDLTITEHDREEIDLTGSWIGGYGNRDTMELILSKKSDGYYGEITWTLSWGVRFWSGEVYYEDNIFMMEPVLEIEQTPGNISHGYMYFVGSYYDGKLQGDFRQEDYSPQDGSHLRSRTDTFQFIKQ